MSPENLQLKYPLRLEVREFELQVEFDASYSSFSYDNSSLDMGEGIVVTEFVIEDGWNARASVVIDNNAELGTRDVSLSTGNGSFVNRRWL